jgi:uncharacterized protein YbcI
LTKAEQRLIAEGERETVLHTRRTFHRTMRKDMIAAVEELTGRRVESLMSDQGADPDAAIAVFLLEAREGAEARA